MILSGNPFDYVIAFFGGVMVSFTPCVYPLIPISIGYIGASAAGSKLKGFTLSLAYVTGVAVTYSVLGLLASLGGTLFGTISSHPVTYFTVGIVIILFGFSMLGLFFIPLPQIIKPLALKKKGYLEVFFLGLSSGLIASPCLTPVLGTILVYLTAKGNIFYGTTLLFSFAYGMGTVLIIAGTLGAQLINLTKSGKWMTYIKNICAFLLIAMGIYFIYEGTRRII